MTGPEFGQGPEISTTQTEVDEKLEQEPAEKTELTPEQIETARNIIESDNQDTENDKEKAIGLYEDANIKLQKFREARRIIMQLGNSEGLSGKMAELQQKIGEAKEAIENAQNELDKTSFLKFSKKSELKAGIMENEGEVNKLAESLEKLNDTLAEVQKAEKDFVGLTEGQLLADAAEAKREAEKF